MKTEIIYSITLVSAYFLAALVANLYRSGATLISNAVKYKAKVKYDLANYLLFRVLKVNLTEYRTLEIIPQQRVKVDLKADVRVSLAYINYTTDMRTLKMNIINDLAVKLGKELHKQGLLKLHEQTVPYSHIPEKQYTLSVEVLKPIIH